MEMVKLILFLFTLLASSLITMVSATFLEKVHVKLTFVDGYTGKPVEGHVWLSFWEADELWKENMIWEMEDETKFVQNCLDLDANNGVIDVKLPFIELTRHGLETEKKSTEITEAVNWGYPDSIMSSWSQAVYLANQKMET